MNVLLLALTQSLADERRRFVRLGHIASITRDVSPVLQAMLPTKAPAEHRNVAPEACR
jgi:hypothetical protein